VQGLVASDDEGEEVIDTANYRNLPDMAEMNEK